MGTVGVAFFERSLESNHNRLLFRTSSSAPKEVVKTEFLECRCSEERYATTRPRPIGRSMGCRISNGAVLLNPDGSDASERERRTRIRVRSLMRERARPPAGRPAPAPDSESDREVYRQATDTLGYIDAARCFVFQSKIRWQGGCLSIKLQNFFSTDFCFPTLY